MPVTGNTEQTRPENRAYYPALDGLRAIALFLVFLQHYISFPWGWTGVDLFFVLSGFLITGILFDSRQDPHRVRTFFVRRTLRIFPLFYGVLLLLVLLQPFARWDVSWAWLEWPAYLGNFARFVAPYPSNSPLQRLADFQLMHLPRAPVVHHTLYLGHLWSLCVEEQFYLLWPWVVFQVRTRRSLLLICAASLPFALLLRLFAQHTAPSWMLSRELLYRATPFRIDALLLGGLVALLLRGPLAEPLKRFARILLPPCLFIALLWAYLPLLHERMIDYHYPAWKFTFGLTLVDFLSALVILITIQPATILFRVLNLKPLRWVGRISYGAYVFHDIPHLFYTKHAALWFPHHFRLGVILIALPCTLLLAWASFTFFESRFINLKNRWAIPAPSSRTRVLANSPKT